MHNRFRESSVCVCAGFVVLDVIRSAIDDNTVVERRYAGGTCGNITAILSYLGMRTAAVTRLGSDGVADEIVSDLSHFGVDTSFVIRDEAMRSPIIIQESFVNRRGETRHRFLRSCPECGAFMPSYRAVTIPAAVSIAERLPHHHFFFFDRANPGILRLARESRSRGALVVFEPSGVTNPGVFTECLKVAHVLKYSDDRRGPMSTYLANANVPLQIETLGARGLRYRSAQDDVPGRWRHVGAFPVNSLRDAAGSGDWCTAGLIAQLASLSTDPREALQDPEVIEEMLTFAQALAALNCAYDGARGLMYSLSATETKRAATRLLQRTGDAGPVPSTRRMSARPGRMTAGCSCSTAAYK